MKNTALEALDGLRLETVDCAVCSSPNYRVLRPDQYLSLSEASSIEAYYSSSSDQQLFDQVVECRNCRLVYLNPRVAPEIILQGYSSQCDERFVLQNPARIVTFRKSLKKILRTVGLPHSRETRVIDIGCAGGAFLKAAADEGLSPVGIEPSRWLCEYARKTYGADIKAGTLEEHAFAPGSFHLITLWDVIEHVSDPAALLKKCRSLIRNDGFLVVNFPDYGSWMRALMGWRWPFFLSVHLYYFTFETLSALLKSSGFRPIEFWPHWQQLPLEYVLKRAEAILPGLGLLARVSSKLKIGKVPLTYQMGQTLVIAKPD